MTAFFIGCALAIVVIVIWKLLAADADSPRDHDDRLMAELQKSDGVDRSADARWSVEPTARVVDDEFGESRR